jgi:dihydrodipicolinate synthase/N-acetylneuraminate lyase
VTTLDRTTLRGVWGTVLLPLDGAGQIDVGRLRRQLDVLTAAGLDGLYAHGTAGEFHELDEDEYDLVSGLLAEHANAAGVPFQLGAGHMSARLSQDRVRRAARLRPDAIQVILPDWVPLPPSGAVAAVAGLAAAAGDIPLVLYNPPHAKTQLDPATLIRLADEVPQLIGIKVAGGDTGWYQAMRPVTARLAVFVAGHTLASGLAQGAAGSYSNVACLSPAGAAAWSALMATDPPRAAELETRLQAFLNRHVLPLQQRGFANPALDKTLAHIGGWADIGTRVRWPYQSVPEDEATALRPLARAALPELFPTGLAPQPPAAASRGWIKPRQPVGLNCVNVGSGIGQSRKDGCPVRDNASYHLG